MLVEAIKETQRLVVKHWVDILTPFVILGATILIILLIKWRDD